MDSKPSFVLTTSAAHFYPQLRKFGEVYLTETRTFPDGETYVRLNPLPEGRSIIVHSGAPHADIGLSELESVLDILDKEGLESDLLFTYMPYSRQDKRFKRGEPNRAERIISNLSSNYRSLNRILSFDTHFAGEEWVKKYNFQDISVVPMLKQAVEEKYPEVTYVVPDAGAKRRTGLTAAKKKRESDLEVDITLSSEMIDLIENSKSIAIIDDMISTGGTMVKIADEIKKYKSDMELIAISTHGLLVRGKESEYGPLGVSKIAKAYTELFITNSINFQPKEPIDAKVIDISPRIAELF